MKTTTEAERLRWEYGELLDRLGRTPEGPEADGINRRLDRIAKRLEDMTGGRMEGGSK